MKKKCFVLFIVFIVSIFQSIYSQNNSVNIYESLKQTKDYSNEKISFRKLKKLLKENKTNDDEIVQYSIELYVNHPLSDSDRIKLVKDIIYPIALTGNLKAIHFFKHSLVDEISTSTRNELQSYEFYLNRGIINPELKLYFILMSCKKDYTQNPVGVYFRYDILKSYLHDLNINELQAIRENIDDKLNQLDNIIKSESVERFKKFDLNIYNPKLFLQFRKVDQKFDFQSYFIYCSSAKNNFMDFASDISGVELLKLIRKQIDFILVKEGKSPKSLINILNDLKLKFDDYTYYRQEKGGLTDSSLVSSYFNDENIKENKEFYYLKNFLSPKNQFFNNDSLNARIIYKQLAGFLPCTGKFLDYKIYYLKRASEFGDLNSIFNIASIYQVLYYQTNNLKYNDSCIYYLEKIIPFNHVDAITLKGIKLFNGEGYIQNNEEGINLIKKAQSMGGVIAEKILEEYPRTLLIECTIYEGYYFGENIKINNPWDFKVRCSNRRCGKYTYPEKIIFGKGYRQNNDIYGLPQIKSSIFFTDDFGNPIINISSNDFKSTFKLASIAKHVMCSNQCQTEFENWKNSYSKTLKNEDEQYQNEKIKCLACSKVLKRKEMITINICPCIESDGKSIGITFPINPRVCSSQCQINYCKTKCSDKGYRYND
jgi:hypothetical protein